MSQDTVTALMRRLAITEEGRYSEYRLFCDCEFGSVIESPTLVLREDGTSEIEMDCLCRSRETPRIVHVVYLPGFRSGHELAEWLVTYRADAMVKQWKTAAETNPATKTGAVSRLQALVDASRSARYCPVSAEDVLDVMGWLVGDPPLREEDVRRVMEFVGCRDNLDFPRPRLWARWTLEANSVASAREERSRQPRRLRLALDPCASPAQLRNLLADGDPCIAAGVLQNPSAPDDLKAWATRLLPTLGPDPDPQEVPF